MEQTEIRYIRVRGLEFRVAVRPGADPARPPLVLCNGIGASLELLEPFVAALDPAIEVVTFDVPGVGGAPNPAYPYNFPIMACLLGGLLTDLGYDRVDVFGISWGGALAQQFALQNPQRARRVVLVATATGAIMVPAHPSVYLKMGNLRRYREPEYARAIAGEIYGGRLREHPEVMGGMFHDRAKVGSSWGYFFQLLAGLGWTSIPFLPLVRQPTLILAGDDDPLIPLENAKIMHRLLPNSTLHVYPDGHLGLMTRTEELAGLVGDFLRSEH